MEIEEFLNDNNYRHVSDARKRLKEKLVEYKGGACEVCGYNKCITALEFHHVNPNEKEFGIGSMKVLSFEKCKKEVDKCMLVCANCHREIHHQQAIENQQKEEEIRKEIYGEILNNRDEYNVPTIRDSYKYLAYTDIFEDIKNDIGRENILRKYHISNKTFNKFLQENNIQYSKRKTVVNKPSKEELIGLLEKYTKNEIAKTFNVSWNAVNKWCKKYGI